MIMNWEIMSANSRTLFQDIIQLVLQQRKATFFKLPKEQVKGKFAVLFIS